MGSFQGWNPSHNAARLGLGLFWAQHYFPVVCSHLIGTVCTSSCFAVCFAYSGCHHMVGVHVIMLLFALYRNPFYSDFFFFCTQQTTCQLMSMSEIGFYKRNSPLWFSNTATQTLLVHIFLRLLKDHSACSAYSVINMKKARLYLLLMFISSG